MPHKVTILYTPYCQICGPIDDEHKGYTTDIMRALMLAETHEAEHGIVKQGVKTSIFLNKDQIKGVKQGRRPKK